MQQTMKFIIVESSPLPILILLGPKYSPILVIYITMEPGGSMTYLQGLSRNLVSIRIENMSFSNNFS